MTYRIVLAAVLAMFCTARAGAQNARDKTTSVADSTKRKLAGTWEGSYVSDHAPEGPMRLVIARDTSWIVTIDLKSELDIPTAHIADFAVNGNVVTWTQELMGTPCQASGVVVATTIKGEVKCGPAAIGFLVRKK